MCPYILGNQKPMNYKSQKYWWSKTFWALCEQRALSNLSDCHAHDAYKWHTYLMSPNSSSYVQRKFRYTIYIKLLFSGIKRFDHFFFHHHYPQSVKIDLNKKYNPKQKTIQTFDIDAQGFRKTKNENPPTWELRVTS